MAMNEDVEERKFAVDLFFTCKFHARVNAVETLKTLAGFVRESFERRPGRRYWREVMIVCIFRKMS